MKNLTKEQFFKRQITLSEIGEKGQEKLLKASVLVVGCGGLGSPIAVYLAMSGVGKIHLIDFDTVAITNLHRQVFYGLDDVGKYKSGVLANFIKEKTPFTKVSFSTKAVQKKTILNLINKFDVIVDGTDSLPTKYLLNDACVLKNKPLVYGSLYKFDGYVSTFNVSQKNGIFSCNLRDAFPVISTDIPNCEEAGTLNPIVGMIALQQVNEVIKLITNVGKLLLNKLLIYNSLQNSQLKIKLKSQDSCYSDRIRKISGIFKKETYFDSNCEVQNSEWLISKEEINDLLTKEKQIKIKIISLIQEKQNYPFFVDKIINIKNIKKIVIDPQKKYIFVCKKGITSYKAVKILKKKYPLIKMLSLVDGIEKN